MGQPLLQPGGHPDSRLMVWWPGLVTRGVGPVPQLGSTGTAAVLPRGTGARIRAPRAPPGPAQHHINPSPTLRGIGWARGDQSSMPAPFRLQLGAGDGADPGHQSGCRALTRRHQSAKPVRWRSQGATRAPTRKRGACGAPPERQSDQDRCRVLAGRYESSHMTLRGRAAEGQAP